MTTTKKTPVTVKWVCAAAIAVLLVAAGVWGGMYYTNNVHIDSVISLDVNPGIEITANKQNRVLEVRAVNQDANAVLDGMELKGTNLTTAVNAIIGSMLQKGYLADNGENEILVTVQNGNPAKVKELKNMIDSALQSRSVDIPVISGTAESSDEAKALADQYQISMGKASYILELAAADPSLDVSALAGMSVKELNALKNGGATDPEHTQQNGNTITSTSTPETSSTAPSAAVPQATQPPTSSGQPVGEITLERAKQIALEHAGLSTDKVVMIKARLDYEDGIRVYDVEFYSGNKEYDYEINAQTGAIHSVDWDVESFSTPNSSSTGGGNNGASISADRAKQIALNHAGLSTSDVSYIKAELDYEHSRLVYEIEFRQGRMEYDYEIDAYSGAVLRHERDWD